jgi:hypothetical protein
VFAFSCSLFVGIKAEKKIVPRKIRAKPIILEIALIRGFGVRRDLRFCEKVFQNGNGENWQAMFFCV